MKFPKTTKRHCPFCRKHTEHKISLVSSGHKRGAMKRGGKARVRKRGKWRGMGNKGRYSRPTVPKRKIKSTKKSNLLYTCQVCKKSHGQKKGKRAGKVQIEAKAERVQTNRIGERDERKELKGGKQIMGK